MFVWFFGVFFQGEVFVDQDSEKNCESSNRSVQESEAKSSGSRSSQSSVGKENELEEKGSFAVPVVRSQLLLENINLSNV